MSRHIAFALVDGARHLPRWSIRTALKLKSAFCAVVFAGAVESIVALSFTRVPVVVSFLPPGQR